MLMKYIGRYIGQYWFRYKLILWLYWAIIASQCWYIGSNNMNIKCSSGADTLHCSLKLFDGAFEIAVTSRNHWIKNQFNKYIQ